jgi:hypothetical protein
MTRKVADMRAAEAPTDSSAAFAHAALNPPVEFDTLPQDRHSAALCLVYGATATCSRRVIPGASRMAATVVPAVESLCPAT